LLFLSIFGQKWQFLAVFGRFLTFFDDFWPFLGTFNAFVEDTASVSADRQAERFSGITQISDAQLERGSPALIVISTHGRAYAFINFILIQCTG